LRQLRDKFNELGLKRKSGKELAVSNYQKLLKNPIYTGLMLYNGEIHEGKHEPIISKKLFDSVQEVMMRKSKPHSKGLKPFLYRGFFRCGECGCFITTETQKGHNYLRCMKRKNPCSQKYTREEIITSEIQKEIKKVSSGILPAGVIITGGAAKLPNIVDLAKKELKLPCRIGLPIVKQGEIEESEFLGENEKDPSFSTAWGLILSGMSDYEPEGRFPLLGKGITDRIKKIIRTFIP